MKRIEVIVPQGDPGEIAKALAVEGVTGMTIGEVRGWGVRQSQPQTGLEDESRPKIQVDAKTKVEMVVPALEADYIMDRLHEAIEATGIGPAKMFCSPVDDARHTRSGARGRQALAWRFVVDD